MPPELFPFGEAYADLDPDHFTAQWSRETLSICLTSSDFEVIELRHKTTDNGILADIIVVDCVNDCVPSQNPVGIKVREPIALVFVRDHMPEVRALRKSFPNVSHLNHVSQNQPASLCLYFEPWTAVRRSWTPQKFLQRILWWLSEAAKGTLHRSDQPVEQLYFDSPFEVILPPDFDKKVTTNSLALAFWPVSETAKTIRGVFLPKDQTQTHQIPQIEILVLNLPPVVHGFIEFHPRTLGELHDQLQSRGAPFVKQLVDVVRERVPTQGLSFNPAGRVLLMLTIPVKRTPEGDPEAYEARGFLLPIDLGSLGQSLGILTKLEGKFYFVQMIGNAAEDGSGTATWRNLDVLPIEVKKDVTKGMARMASGILDEKCDFKGSIAGVGALGSALCDLWSKECWGEWSLIDNDILKPHNVVRHIGKNRHCGLPKVDVVKEIVEGNYYHGYYSANIIMDVATNWENNEVRETIRGSEFFVDATTTLEVPREMARRDDVPRSASVFLSPSAQSSVLLLESADRTNRLDSLEAQYYRGILNSEWGTTHLTGHRANLWVGAGCRDISTVISNELVLLHASILARQTRILRDQPSSRIRVWCARDDNSEVSVHEISVEHSMCVTVGRWKVIWDSGIERKLKEIRNAHLPNETGGVVLGYTDHYTQTMMLVDVLAAPPDSEEDQTGFLRGIEGLAVGLEEVHRLTAGIVGYLGEWHSHPAFASARPSVPADQALIAQLARTLYLDGEPGVMVIVGSAGEISITIEEGIR
jgi:hypothetical protein